MRLEVEPEWGISGRDSRLGFRDMTLGELLDGLETVEIAPSAPASRDLRISSLDYDSRRIAPGGIFFALAGAKTDGKQFVPQAIDRGAIAVVSEQPRPASLPDVVVWVRVPAGRRALALVAANFYGRPAQALSLVGVTGTNGKTTTTFLIDSILRAAGRRTGIFGTVLWRTPARAALASTTTPESLELTRLFAELRDAGGTDAVLEVSSHALALDRVWGCHFAAAIFTNLTRDHLDFHRTMENYFAAKRRLFEGTGAGAPDNGVINLDDPHAPALAGLARRTISYGLTSLADVTTESYRLDSDGLAFTARTPAGPIELRSRLVGAVNVSNILAAVATALAVGVDRDAIARGVARMVTVPGRFERVEQGQPFLVAVDYAHTDDALRRLLETARELKLPGRILLLFGAGGDRDRAKRPLMGEAAAHGSDLAVVTSDNPRSEDPMAIIEEILPGLAGAEYIVEPDRARAIGRILAEAKPGDIVLLAGKGHETYQVLRDRTIPFDDRLVARQVLREMGYERNSAASGGEATG
jgi:UDP-N-acetylmuramoyl-L-alanyl-D-glutamate--2,6-diaminopimelate ligase